MKGGCVSLAIRDHRGEPPLRARAAPENCENVCGCEIFRLNFWYFRLLIEGVATPSILLPAPLPLPGSLTKQI